MLQGKEKFDIVIVGSGLGGLMCGLLLAKEGYKICILEKNRQFGGNLQTYVREKCIFDTGVHYIGGLEKGQNLYQIFKYLGIMDQLKLRKLDEDCFDAITFEGDPLVYRYAQGYDKFYQNLAAQFPDEQEAIQKYCQKLQEVSTHFPLFNLAEGNSTMVQSDALETNARDYIASLTQNVTLRNVLGGTNPLYAGDPEKTPLYVHALVIHSYIQSSWKCVDGGSQIERLLTKAIRAQGGVVRNYSEVKKFIFEDELIRFAELANGERIEGTNFISNAHPAQTLEMIEPGKVRKAYRTRITSLENTISVFILNIVLKENTFPYLNYNHYHYRNKNVWGGLDYSDETWPEGFALFTPASSKSEKYADSIILMSYMKYEEVEAWKESFSTIPRNVENRGEGYDQFKAKKAEKLLDMLESQYPGVRENIKSVYTSTPLSYRDYIGTPDGSLYGIIKDYKDPLKTFISPKTKVSNLFLTGQNINIHGVLGVSISSLVTCAEFCGLNYLVRKIKEV
jgi:all-trans-retinol 13,14-reductase